MRTCTCMPRRPHPVRWSSAPTTGSALWLNGVPVFSLRTHRQAFPDQNTHPVTLQQGWNRLLVKNDQLTGAWGFYMRLLAPDGKPLTGIKYQLDKPTDSSSKQ